MSLSHSNQQKRLRQHRPRLHRPASGSPRPHSRTTNDQNQLTDIGADYALTYDNADNMTQDQLGRQYTYDAWNRLVAVTEHDGTWIIGFQYDGLGRRTQIITVDDTWTLQTNDLYVSAAGQVLNESARDLENVWSPVYVNALIRQTEGENDPTYVTTDLTYSVTATWTLGYNTSRIAYSAYGVATYYEDDTTGGGAFETPTITPPNLDFGWQGGMFFQPINSYAFGVRIYRPDWGRWTTVDPIRDGMNWFEGMADNPVNLGDPLGLDAEVTGTRTEPGFGPGPDGKGYGFKYAVSYNFKGLPAGAVLVQHNSIETYVISSDGKLGVGTVDVIVDVSPAGDGANDTLFYGGIDLLQRLGQLYGNKCGLYIKDSSTLEVAAGAEIDVGSYDGIQIPDVYQPKWTPYLVNFDGQGMLSRFSSTWSMGGGEKLYSKTSHTKGTLAKTLINDALIVGPKLMEWTHEDEVVMKFDDTNPKGPWIIQSGKITFSSQNPAIDKSIAPLNWEHK